MAAIGTMRNVWSTARQDTQRAAAALPDVKGLHSVKNFVQHHPVLSTCAVLGVAWYTLGGALPTLVGLRTLARARR